MSSLVYSTCAFASASRERNTPFLLGRVSKEQEEEEEEATNDAYTPRLARGIALGIRARSNVAVIASD